MIELIIALFAYFRNAQPKINQQKVNPIWRMTDDVVDKLNNRNESLVRDVISKLGNRWILFRG